MRTLTAVLASMILIGSAGAQTGRAQRVREVGQDPLRARFEKKLAAPFLKKADWTTDYDRALARAREENKVVFAYLTRSYAPCPWCVRCERGALSEPAFAKFAKKCVALCHITSKLPKARHQGLLRRVGGQGFPHIVFLDAKGRVLATQDGEERSVRGFERTLAIIERMRSSAAKAEESEVARVEVALCKIELGETKNPVVARSRLEAAGTPSAEQKPRIARALDEVEVAYLMRRSKRKKKPSRVGPVFAAMLERGHVPHNKRRARFFWQSLGLWAKSQDKHALIQRSKNELKKLDRR